MAGDLFERLAEVEVPPMPDNLDRDIHQRVNRGAAGFTFCRIGDERDGLCGRPFPGRNLGVIDLYFFGTVWT